MMRIMKKIVSLITISTGWLLLVILPEIQAQQTAKLPSTTAPSPVIFIYELKSRLSDIESMANIDAATKTDSLKFIDQAIQYLELANSTNKKEQELSRLIQTSPGRHRNRGRGARYGNPYPDSCNYDRGLGPQGAHRSQ